MLNWMSSPETIVELTTGEHAAFICGPSPTPSTMQQMRPSVAKSELKRQFTEPDSYIDLQRE
jgi:hypothetical protein